ncbi:MAG: hypothetical protein GW748_07155 [Alphaproteobacteria bacterium]|nr:hypothetical protein [Alphaproteobacteria bacterium]
MENILNKNLKILCLITACEKFAFHGVRFTLVLYLIQHLNFPESESYVAYGALMALTNCAPIFIGWIYDKLCSLIFLSILGSLFLFFGSMIICLPFDFSLYLGVGAIILGGGTLRTTIPIMLGNLYVNNSTGKSSGFTFLYVSINVGALLSALICGYLGEKIGWHYSFLMTAIAALLSYIFLYMFSPSISEERNNLQKTNKKTTAILLFLFISIFLSFLVKFNFFIDYIILAIAIFVSYWLFRLYLNNKTQRDGIRKVIYLMLLQIGFFALYEQGPSSFVIFINSFVNKTIRLGLTIPPFEIPLTFFQAIDPAVNLAVGSVFTYLWYHFLLKSDSEYIKFSLGFLLIGLAFFTISYSPAFFPLKEIPSLFMALIFSLIVIGELLIVPIGLSSISTIDIEREKGRLMGVWCLSVGIGQWVATYISRSIPYKKNSSDIEYLNSFSDIYLLCSFFAVALSGVAIAIYTAKKSACASGVSVAHE